MKEIPDDWVHGDIGEGNHSPSHYAEDDPYTCQKCGAELEWYGDRVSTFVDCPNCDVRVYEH